MQGKKHDSKKNVLSSQVTLLKPPHTQPPVTEEHIHAIDPSSPYLHDPAIVSRTQDASLYLESTDDLAIIDRQLAQPVVHMPQLPTAEGFRAEDLESALHGNDFEDLHAAHSGDQQQYNLNSTAKEKAEEATYALLNFQFDRGEIMQVLERSLAEKQRSPIKPLERPLYNLSFLYS
mgnify:FL=1